MSPRSIRLPQGLDYYRFCSTDDPRLIFDRFTDRSNFYHKKRGKLLIRNYSVKTKDNSLYIYSCLFHSLTVNLFIVGAIMCFDYDMSVRGDFLFFFVHLLLYASLVCWPSYRE